MVDVFVNGERVEFDEQSRLDFLGVFIVQQNQSKIGIYFNSGVSIVTKTIEDFLTYQISIPTRFKGNWYIITMQLCPLSRAFPMNFKTGVPYVNGRTRNFHSIHDLYDYNLKQ